MVDDGATREEAIGVEAAKQQGQQQQQQQQGVAADENGEFCFCASYFYFNCFIVYCVNCVFVPFSFASSRMETSGRRGKGASELVKGYDLFSIFCF